MLVLGRTESGRVVSEAKSGGLGVADVILANVASWVMVAHLHQFDSRSTSRRADHQPSYFRRLLYVSFHSLFCGCVPLTIRFPCQVRL